jgi:chromosome partitioning protein
MEFMKIISFQNQKGGVGKSTLSLMLANALSNLGKSVVFLDNDPQANSTRWFSKRIVEHDYDLESVKRKIIDYNIGTLIQNEDTFSFDEYLIDVPDSNIKLLPSTPTYEEAKISQNQPGYEDTFKYLFSDLESDYMIVDSPGELSQLTNWGLSIANVVVVPVETELFASETIDIQIKRIQKAQKKVNVNLNKIIIIPNRHDYRHVIEKEAMNFLIENYSDYLIFDNDNQSFPVFFPDRTEIQKFIAEGRPIKKKDITEPLKKFVNKIINGDR